MQQFVGMVLRGFRALWAKGCIGKAAAGTLTVVLLGVITTTCSVIGVATGIIPELTATPRPRPTTVEVAAAPTRAPSPTTVPTAQPEPTAAPSATARPTQAPTAPPTQAPTVKATAEPTVRPTVKAIQAPTAAPAPKPTVAPPAPAPAPTAAPPVHRDPVFTNNEVDPPWWPCLEGQIKGNRDSKKYHVPGGQFYARTYEGVDCFDSAAAAEAAGFVRSKR